jgi:hypothetical protein
MDTESKLEELAVLAKGTEQGVQPHHLHFSQRSISDPS